MSDLSEVYSIIEGLQKRNLPIPDELQKEATDCELALLRNKLTAAMQQYIETITSQIKNKFVLVCEHTPGKPLTISVSRESDIVGLLDDAVTITTPNEEEITVVEELAIDNDDEEDENETGSTKARSIGFTVQFADGHVVSEPEAKNTLINTLRYMGFEKVSKFTSKTFKGFHLVDKRKRMDRSKDGRDNKWQEPVENGWFVYINMRNDTKKIVLRSVADFLNIPITITDNEDKTDVLCYVPTSEKMKGHRQLYSFNGRPPLDKRNSVLAVVKHFVANHPNATYKEIHRSFPDQVQGGYGVIKTIDEINVRRKEGQEVDRRYFLESYNILTSADGVQFAVCNQWGTQFYQFQNHIRNFGWELKEFN